MDEPPYHVEIEGLEEASGDATSGLRGRPWIGIRFDCCDKYARVYRNLEGTHYSGRCPCCLRVIRLRVGPDGTDARFFLAE